MMHQGLPDALRELVERVSGSIRSGQVVDAYLAGGVATYLHVRRAGGSLAAQARYSEDADIHFGRALIPGDDVVVRYVDHSGEERLLALDRSYSIDIGLRHPDCFDDAEYLFDSSNGRLRLYMLNPLDLAVTKTGRFQDHDKADIALMARAGLLDAENFTERASEALEYLATDPAMVAINIDEAAELIRESRRP